MKRIWGKNFFLLLTAFFAVGTIGCYNCYVDETDLSNITDNGTKSSYLDSIAQVYVKSDSSICKKMECISTEISWPQTKVNGTLRLSVQLKDEKDTATYSSNVIAGLDIEIFGCASYTCEDANKIIVHNRDYTFSRILRTDEYSVSTLEESGIKAAGELHLKRYFNLKINIDELELNIDVLDGKSECEHCGYESPDFHLPGM